MHFQGVLYIPKTIYTKVINRHYDNLLADYFRIEKTSELVTQKYYWPTFYHDVKAYIKGCDIYLALESVKYKLYGDIQLLSYYWENFSINFVAVLSIDYWLTKIVYIN